MNKTVMKEVNKNCCKELNKKKNYLNQNDEKDFEKDDSSEENYNKKAKIKIFTKTNILIF